MSAYRDAGIEVIPGDLYITLGNTAADGGDLEGTENYYTKALENFRLLSRRSGEAIALSNLAWVGQQKYNFENALALLEQSMDVRRAIGDTVGLPS